MFLTVCHINGIILFDFINIIAVYLYKGFLLSHAGPVLPQQPTNLMDNAIGTGGMSIMIRWTVPIIAYTPENYVVNYGTSMGSLVMTSAMVMSGSDFEAVNQVFSVTLTGLVDTTTYFYQVVATNGQGSTSSDIQSFTTTILRKLTNERTLEHSVHFLPHMV